MNYNTSVPKQALLTIS